MNSLKICLEIHLPKKKCDVVGGMMWIVERDRTSSNLELWMFRDVF